MSQSTSPTPIYPPEKQTDILPLHQPPKMTKRRLPLLLPITLITLTILLFWHTTTRTTWIPFKDLSSLSTPSTPTTPTTPQKSPTLIPLEAHIMSKCPDARDCLSLLLLPIMSTLSSHVNFTLSYIGQSTPHDDGVLCPHGPTECLGNIIELCAADLYPHPKQWLSFTMCLENDYEKIPEREFVQGCAAESGMGFERIKGCLDRDDGGYGVGLLRRSVERSKSLGVQYSCTVRLDDKVRCIRESGKWIDCEGGSEVGDLKRDIEALYKERNAL